MLQIVKTSTIKEYERRIKELGALVDDKNGLIAIQIDTIVKLQQTKEILDVALDSADKKSETLIESLSQKDAEIAALKAKLDPIADRNAVTIAFDDNLIDATPIVRYKPEVIEKLIELGYMTDAVTDKFAIQLALLTMSQEVLTQIVESFAE